MLFVLNQNEPLSSFRKNKQQCFKILNCTVFFLSWRAHVGSERTPYKSTLSDKIWFESIHNWLFGTSSKNFRKFSQWTCFFFQTGLDTESPTPDNVRQGFYWLLGSSKPKNHHSSARNTRFWHVCFLVLFYPETRLKKALDSFFFSGKFSPRVTKKFALHMWIK